MGLVRFRVACRGRVEFCSVPGADIDIGRDPSCALVLHHPSVAPLHARVLVRRSRLILADLGRAKTATTRGRERVLAPVTLVPGETFGVGDVALAAWHLEAEEPLPIAGAGVEIGPELESADAGLRRYLVLQDGGVVQGELAIARRELDRATARRWAERVAASASGIGSERLAALLEVGRVDPPFLIERLPPGIRLGALLDGVARRAVHLPVEATIVIVAHLADAVAGTNSAWGPHGAIDPRSVHLGVDGSVWLLRPGPLADRHDTILDDFLAPERRFGLPASREADAFALGMLGKKVLFHRSDCPARIRAICCWLAHANPARRPRDLVEVAAELRRAAQTARLDPTFGHVARSVRLLAPTGRRLCSVQTSV